MPSSSFRVAADVVVVLHVGFVVFVLLGGLFVLRWRWVAWLHVPAAVWGVIIEYGGGVCPLTPLEIYLRQRSGGAAYSGDFVEHYLLPLLYPAGLTRRAQFVLGTLALAANAFVYLRVLHMRRSRRSPGV